MTTIEDAYSSVKYFDDLLKINIKYLNGVYDETCYHYGNINMDTLSIIDELKVINRLGFYTINTQLSSQHIDWVKNSNQNANIYNHTYKENINDGNWVCYQHRGFIEGLYKSKYDDILIDFLENCNDIYYIIEPKNGYIKTNIDNNVLDNQHSLYKSDRLYLSRETRISGNSLCYDYGINYPHLVNKLFNSCIQTSYWRNGNTTTSLEGRRDEIVELHDDYDNILKVLNKTSSLVIITKDFNTSFSLEDLLINFFTNHV